MKSKCRLTDNFPIIAFVEKLGAKPRRVASFYLGRRERGKLLYGGKIESGYTWDEAQEIREALDPFIRKDSPLDEEIDKPKATWVEPVVEAEIDYRSKTDAGLVRHGSFKGLRDDLATVDIPRPPAPALRARKEAPEQPHGNRYAAPQNMLQLLPDAVAPTADALEDYWRKVGPKALKYLARRPLKLVRHVGSRIFYHKQKLPPIRTTCIRLRLRSGKAVQDCEYGSIASMDSLPSRAGWRRSSCTRGMRRSTTLRRPTKSCWTSIQAQASRWPSWSKRPCASVR